MGNIVCFKPVLCQAGIVILFATDYTETRKNLLRHCVDMALAVC